MTEKKNASQDANCTPLAIKITPPCRRTVGVCPHHTCAALYAYTHYSFIRSLSFVDGPPILSSFVDGPPPTNFSYTLTK